MAGQRALNPPTEVRCLVPELLSVDERVRVPISGYELVRSPTPSHEGGEAGRRDLADRRVGR